MWSMITTPLKIITMLKCDRVFINITIGIYIVSAIWFYLVICVVIHVVSRIVKSQKSNTHYLTIPADMVVDSQYPFQDGDEVEIIINPKTKTLEVRKK